MGLADRLALLDQPDKARAYKGKAQGMLEEATLRSVAAGYFMEI